jgi:hypothetical protein
MRIVVFGANGLTGRLLTERALGAGHHVAAVTRRPAEFPITHERLDVVEADVHDAQAVDRAVEGADVVLSALGVPFTRKPISVYSDSGLFDAPGVTSYELHKDQAPGIFTSRADLAASLPEQATDVRFVRKAVAVTTSEGAPTLFQVLRREAFKRD